MNFDTVKRKFVKDLKDNFIPFWENAVDKQYGGVFTCYTNKGDRLVSEKKYTWSQGRFLWLCCNLLKMKKQGIIQLSGDWDKITEDTYRFLTDYTLMDNNHTVVFAVERNGEKIEAQMNISIFADCFYILGCNAYAGFKKDESAFENVLLVYKSVKQRIQEDNFHSEPYPIPTGYRSHSIPMILLNVAEELYETAKSLNHTSESYLAKDARTFLEEITNELSDGNRIREMLPSSERENSTLLARHLNPGHSLESVWFMVHTIEKLNLQTDDYLNHLAQISENALSLGWDDQYGGLLRFVDKEGGEPKGDRIDSSYEALIMGTWDTKLWWPHGEALYTTLLLFEKTENEKWLGWYRKLEDYIFNTFPNPDENIGEWIQIRNRKGEPLEKVVALPVKDPFHIMRSYLLIISLLERTETHASGNK